jgi:hypothetical protein
MVVFSLAMIAALLAVIVPASGVAEAQRGGGVRGGGGAAKPSGVSKPSSEAKQSLSAKSGERDAGSGMYSTGYGIRHGSLELLFVGLDRPRL